MQAALDILRAELASVDARRRSLVIAIEAVEPLVSPVPPSSHVVVVDEAHRHTPGAAATPIVLHEEPPKVDPVGAARLNRLIAAEKRAKAGLKDDESRCLDVLRTRGALSLKAFVDASGMPRERARFLLAGLRKRGLILAEGATTNRVFFVKGAKVASPREGEDLEPVWDGSMKQAPADVLQARREAGR